MISADASTIANVARYTRVEFEYLPAERHASLSANEIKAKEAKKLTLAIVQVS